MDVDRKLIEAIRNAMRKDERLSGQSIDVLAKNGVVELVGTVHSYRRKLAAQEIASTFEGCRDVVNRLVVKPPCVVPDEDVTNGVRAALDAHADITKEVITVSVSSGTVTLRGQVRSNWERLLAEDVALSVRGVRKVENALFVDPMGRVEDEAMSYEIKEALSSARGLKDADVHVAVTGDLAVLSGTVQALWQKETASLVARRFPVRTVRNDMVVTGP